MVILVALVYRFGGVFFLIELDFFYLFIFFSHVVKKKQFKRKAKLLNFIKSMDMFTCVAG
jgi:hypothetical protein